MSFSRFFLARHAVLYTLFSIVVAVPKIIYKDVAILGGGASGSHAAVRLREDFNKSVIIIEKQENLVRISQSSFPNLYRLPF